MEKDRIITFLVYNLMINWSFNLKGNVKLIVE